MGLLQLCFEASSLCSKLSFQTSVICDEPYVIPFSPLMLLIKRKHCDGESESVSHSVTSNSL